MIKAIRNWIAIRNIRKILKDKTEDEQVKIITQAVLHDEIRDHIRSIVHNTSHNLKIPQESHND